MIQGTNIKIIIIIHNKGLNKLHCKPTSQNCCQRVTQFWHFKTCQQNTWGRGSIMLHVGNLSFPPLTTGYSAVYGNSSCISFRNQCSVTYGLCLVHQCLQWRGISTNRTLWMENAFLSIEYLGICLSLCHSPFTQFTITFQVWYFGIKAIFSILITSSLNISA